MNTRSFTSLVQVAAFTIALAAVLQELEKPKGERGWHGTIGGFIPYDFRMLTIKRLKESYWNPDESRIFTPRPLGIGWAINFYSLLERLNALWEPELSEEDFLMPTPKIKELLTQPQAEE